MGKLLCLTACIKLSSLSKKYSKISGWPIEKFVMLAGNCRILKLLLNYNINAMYSKCGEILSGRNQIKYSNLMYSLYNT